jgi:predicted MFS family arabinose efflux permease
MPAIMSDAQRREFAQGWPATLAAALAISVGMMGIGFYSLGLFVKPLQAEFGWSRAAVSGAATFQQFGIFASAPLIGMLADRIGMRSIAIASYIATPLALIALSQAGPSIPGWYGLWFLVSVAGCGTTPAIWARVVATRFDCARGLALGMMLLGTGTAAILAPALLGPIFAAQGWRTAVLVIAAVTAAIGLPVSLLMPRDRPTRLTGRPAARRRFEANRQTITLLVVAVLLGAIVAGLIIHLVPLLIDRGAAPAAAAQVAATVGVAVLVARVVVGYLFDRFHAPYIAGLFLLAPVASAVLLWLDGPVVPAALLLGLAAGAEVDMLAYFCSRYARLENYGATYGVTLGLFCFGAGCGPMLFGWSVDRTGSYDSALSVSAVLLFAVAGVVATLGPYRSHLSRTTL